MRFTLVLALVVAGIVATSAAQARNDFAIVVSGPRAEWRIGSFYFHQDLGRYPAAVRVFGAPTSRTARAPGQSNLCSVRWTKLSLEMDFASTPASPCSSSNLSNSTWFGARMYAGAWRTDRGLHVGDDLAKLQRLYPNATYRDSARPRWLLVYVRGEVGTTVYLQAQVRDRRVIALEVPPGNVSARR